MENIWKQYKNDFDSMTDAEIEKEVNEEQEKIDEAQEWLDAVASWKAAGCPRGDV